MLLPVPDDEPYTVPVTPDQCRAARGLVDWSQERLAEEAGVGVTAIRLFERRKSSPTRATLRVLQLAFEAAGVEFIEPNGGGAGVRWRATK